MSKEEMVYVRNQHSAPFGKIPKGGDGWVPKWQLRTYPTLLKRIAPPAEEGKKEAPPAPPAPSGGEQPSEGTEDKGDATGGDDKPPTAAETVEKIETLGEDDLEQLEGYLQSDFKTVRDAAQKRIEELLEGGD